MVTQADIEKEGVKEQLFEDQDVVGVGVQSGSREKVTVYVKDLNRRVRKNVPSFINKTPTRLVETGGEFRILPDHVDDVAPLDTGRQQRVRPAPGGVSIGHDKISAGTLGWPIADNAFLTNNHVAANISTEDTDRVGDGVVLQPGPADGGTSSDRLGTTTQYVPLSTDAANGQDSALVIVDDLSMLSQEIMGVGVVNGTLQPSEGMPIRKSGRTTGLTTGETVDVRADMEINYGSEIGKLRFRNQVVTDADMNGGDSGSLMVHGNRNKAVALGFAGSPRLSIGNPINRVLSSYDVSGSTRDGQRFAVAGGLALAATAVGTYLLNR